MKNKLILKVVAVMVGFAGFGVVNRFSGVSSAQAMFF